MQPKPLPIIDSPPGQSKKPPWLRIQAPTAKTFRVTDSIVANNRLNTICEEAMCPNKSECWSHGTATFLLLGETCTRGCAFCAVATGRPDAADPEEPSRVANAAAAMNLRHVVLTSVNRDDMKDGGAEQFSLAVAAIKHQIPDCSIEVLIPDFKGDWSALETVMRSDISVLNHNLESVPRLYRNVRPGAVYERSLELLERAAKGRGDVPAKSGLMLGLGESIGEVIEVMRDFRAVGGSILTLGQYLQPTKKHHEVIRYVHPDEFADLKRIGTEMGFAHVESGPLVRSSYHAWKHVGKASDK